MFEIKDEIISQNLEIIDYIDKSEFLDFIFKNSGDVFWILDETKTTRFISPTIVELTGYTPEEFQNLRFEEKFSDFSLSQLDKIFTNINEITNFSNFPLEYVAKNGSIVSTEVTGKIFRDRNGNFKGLYGITVNKSDKLALESQLTAEKEKSKEAAKFKSIVLGILGHEFKTPLSGILGFSHLLSKNCQCSEDKEMLNFIYQSAQRLNATLNSVVTLAAIESDQLTIKNEPICLEESIDSIIDSFKPFLSNNINLIVKNEFLDGTTIFTDENCFHQILYHLLDNAIKFTDAGSVEICFSTHENDTSNSIQIKVKDTGIGIQKQKVGTIFEPFRQLSEGTDRKYEGLGLGLTTTKKLVEKLNGTINVSSKPNKGSVFTVSLPMKIIV